MVLIISPSLIGSIAFQTEKRLFLVITPDKLVSSNAADGFKGPGAWQHGSRVLKKLFRLQGAEGECLLRSFFVWQRMHECLFLGQSVSHEPKLGQLPLQKSHSSAHRCPWAPGFMMSFKLHGSQQHSVVDEKAGRSWVNKHLFMARRLCPYCILGRRRTECQYEVKLSQPLSNLPMYPLVSFNPQENKK